MRISTSSIEDAMAVATGPRLVQALRCFKFERADRAVMPIFDFPWGGFDIPGHYPHDQINSRNPAHLSQAR
jgi:hypothetical protein